jgi:alpha-mannosidase
MKKISRLIQLLPSERLEDFPTHLKDDLAAGVLANWTAAWHPLLIAASNSAPIVVGTISTTLSQNRTSNATNLQDTTHRDFEESEDFTDSELFEDDLLPKTSPDDHNPIPSRAGNSFVPEFWENSLVFIPEITIEGIAEGFAAQAVGVNAKLITSMVDRDQIIQRIEQLMEITGLNDSQADSISDPLRDRCHDFFALGYAYLQIQLLTRKIRFSSNLDQALFDQKLIDAATAYAAGDLQHCDDRITACYDLLLEEKNNYYPVRPTLIDLVLTTPKTVGAKFKQELASKHANNFLMTAKAIKTADADAIDRLESAIAAGHCSLVGGSYDELPDTILSPETTVNQLIQGRSYIRDALKHDVNVFMRYRFGLMASLPNILDNSNFSGAMHTSLTGGKFPAGSMGTIRWAGDGNASVIAKAETLLDAADPATLLDLGVRIGKQIDSAHESTCTFAHWPGRYHAAYNDLIQVAQRSPVLGAFLTLDEHFDDLYDPGYADNFSSEEYVAPFLEEAIGLNSPVPLSRTCNYWKHYHRLRQIESLILILTVEATKSSSPLCDAHQIQAWNQRCDGYQNQVDGATADWNFDADAHRNLDQSLDEAEEELIHLIERSIEAGGEKASGRAVINPLFFTRQINVSSTAKGQPDRFAKSKSPYFVQQISNQTSHLCIETRGTSVTPLPLTNTLPFSTADGSPTGSPVVKEPQVLDGDTLRNEFFIATICRKTGGLKSILYHGKRGNRCSQRLIWNRGTGHPPSTMFCDRFETVAHFTQTFRLYRGQSVLGIDIELTPAVDIGNSKQKYFASRMAWRDEACKIFGSDQFVMTELSSPKIQSPNFVHIENLDYSLTLLSNGLTYHNRIRRRQLDTLLITAKETARKFSIGLGIDEKYPLKSAIGFATPTLLMANDCVDASQYFHIDNKNVLLTRSRPIFNLQKELIGFDFRFQETQRRRCQMTLYTPFKMIKILRTTFHGEPTETILDAEETPVTQIRLPVGAADYFQIRVLVAPISLC